MKTRQENYAGYLPDSTVDEYCNSSILPFGTEIDHVGLSALKDVLLGPAAMALEVLYLDRSQGSEVNMHRFDPVNNNGYTAATVRLLYRPGHYDLLYKPEDVPPPPTAVPTYLQFSSHTHQEPIYDLGVSDYMTMIPGMSYANPHQAWLSNSSYGGSDFFATSAPVPQCAQPLPNPVVSAAPPQIQPEPVYVPATPTSLAPPPIQMHQELAIRTVPVPHAAAVSHAAFQHQLNGPFRPSQYQYEAGIAQMTCHMPFQTSIFRK